LIYPVDLTIVPTIELVITDIQIDNVLDRTTELHHSPVFVTKELSVVDSKGPMTDGKTMIDPKDASPASPPAVTSQQRWGFFITGTGETVDVDASREANGSSFDTGGVTVGADYRLTENLAIGAAFGYANTRADLNFGGSARSNNGNASIYATYSSRGFYVDGVATGGIGSVDIRRRTIGGVTHGNADTTALGGLLRTGYDRQIGNFSIGPVASLRFARVTLDSFHEGDALGSLYIRDHHQNSLRSAVGLQASYRARVGNVPVTPFVRAQWQHEFLDDRATLDASFDNLTVFEIEGPRLGRDSLRLDAGVSAQIAPRVGVFGAYTTELGRRNYSVHSISGGVRVSF